MCDRARLADQDFCFDGEARESRKEHGAEGSAIEMAASMGVQLLTEEHEP